jgi:Tol biopolymer transport system component
MWAPGEVGRASWSSDGRRLIFEHQLPGNEATNADWVRFAVMNADGSARQDLPLTPAPSIGGPTDLGTFYRSDPGFTRAGTRLIYTRTLYKPPYYPSEIWSAGVDGSDERRVGPGRLGRISPDGRKIAYVRSSRLADNGFDVDFGGPTSLMSARTGRPIRRIWKGTADSIDWAPDGRSVVLTGARPRHAGGLADVYVARADGRGVRRLTFTANASEIDAVWSPDGRRIAFVQEVTTSAEDEYFTYTEAIWTMRANGTARRRIREPWRGSSEDGAGRPKISWQPRPRR